jgi:hypothetical protein
MQQADHKAKDEMQGTSTWIEEITSHSVELQDPEGLGRLNIDPSTPAGLR